MTSDLIDEKGHTREEAKDQHPTLDLDAPPASEKTPEGNQLVPAQSPAEVEAQVKNRAGAPGDTHDLSEQLVNAARYESDEDDGADDGEAAEIAEANEELLGSADGSDDDDES